MHEDNPSGGRRAEDHKGSTVHRMELLLILLLFVGLAVLAAVPLVALLHFSDHRGKSLH